MDFFFLGLPRRVNRLVTEFELLRDLLAASDAIDATCPKVAGSAEGRARLVSRVEAVASALAQQSRRVRRRAAERIEKRWRSQPLKGSQKRSLILALGVTREHRNPADEDRLAIALGSRWLDFYSHYFLRGCELTQTTVTALRRDSNGPIGAALADRITSGASCRAPSSRHEHDRSVLSPAAAPLTQTKVQVQCPSCSRFHKVLTGALGKKGKCKCGQVFVLTERAGPNAESKAQSPDAEASRSLVPVSESEFMALRAELTKRCGLRKCWELPAVKDLGPPILGNCPRELVLCAVYRLDGQPLDQEEAIALILQLLMTARHPQLGTEVAMYFAGNRALGCPTVGYSIDFRTHEADDYAALCGVLAATEREHVSVSSFELKEFSGSCRDVPHRVYLYWST